MNVGDKVKNTVELVSLTPIPAGTPGIIQQIDRLPDGSVALFGYEVAFEGFPLDTYPCEASEIEVVE